jgi:AcrR family transcriptional regulator
MQRMRILHALAEIVYEEGFEAATVSRVCALAGVPTRVLHGLFRNRGDCLEHAFEETVARARARMSSASGSLECWQERVRAGLDALLEFLEQEPELARLCLTQSLAGGPRMLARRDGALRELVVALDPGPSGVGAIAQPPGLIAEVLVDAIVSIVQARLLASRPAHLRGLLGQLMGLIVLPYLGPAAARRELTRTPPALAPAVFAPRSAATDGRASS